MTTLIEHVRRVASRDDAGVGDGELLGRFIERHDEAALAALVRRHGPMVWGVCRRLLAHHDAEDAFQATFLVLVRKAASVVPRAMVGNWLYGVAHQTALHARRTTARRRAKETYGTQMLGIGAVQQDHGSDLRPVLDEELSRLPDIYRAVVVLCDLEGRTRREVARQLGVPDGTVGGRLARARLLLAKRLARRGAVLSAGALAGALSAGPAPAAASPFLVASTIKAASLLAAGPAAGGVSENVATLTQGVTKAMFVTRIKSVLAVVVVGIVIVSGLSVAAPPYALPPVSKPVASAGEPKSKIAAPNVQEHTPVSKPVAGSGEPRVDDISGEKDQALRLVCFRHGDDEKTPSVYVETAHGQWKEFYKGAAFAVYKDVSSSDQYVHLLDESRGTYIRFYKDRAYYGKSKEERGKFLYPIYWAKGSPQGSIW